jgi:tetratricopeptide (TPR) repeat protein
MTHFQKAKKAVEAGDFEQAAREYEQVLRLDPSLAEAHANLGLTYHMLGHYQQAVPELERALEEKPTLLVTNILLGIDFQKLGSPAKAIPPLQRALRLDPSNREARGVLAGCYLAQDEYAEAMKQFRKIFSLEPDQMEGLYGLGKSYLNLAKRSATRISQANQSSSWSSRLEGDLLAERDSWIDAAVEYRRALAIDPKKPGLNASLGTTLLRMGKLETAEATFRDELQVDPENEQALLGLAEIQVRRGAAEAALESISRICQFFPSYLITQPDFLSTGVDAAMAKKLAAGLEKSPPSPGVQFLLTSLYKVAGENGKAREQWAAFHERLGRWQKEDHDSEIAWTADQLCRAHRYAACVNLLQVQKTPSARSNLLLGEALFALAEYDRSADAFSAVLVSEKDNLEGIYWLTRTCQQLADDYLNRLMELYPDSWRGHQSRGDHQKLHGAYNQAIDEYQMAIRLRPMEPELYESLGESYLLVLSYDQAETQLKKALQLDRTRARCFLLLGRAYLGRHEAQESIPCFRTALQYNPDLLQARAFLGQAYMRIGKPVDAVPELESSASLDYYGSLHYLLYNAYRQLGKPELAQQALARSVELRRASEAEHHTRVDEAAEEIQK